jgi:hypothetical protein
MALSDLFGINSTAGTDDLKQALAAIQGVQGPTQQQLTLPQLQQYVKAGVLTPEQYQAVIADPNSYQQITGATDQSGTNAQKAALQQLGGIVQAGGSTPINQANLINNIQQTNQAMQAGRQGIMENAQERNVSGGGMDMINQLMNEQQNSQNANLGAVNAAANNAQLGLNAIAQQGTVGSSLQGQANQMSQAQAQAAQQVAQYNSQLQSQANQYNTEQANQAQQMNLANAQNISGQNTANANARTQYNAQVPQTVYQDQMQKANAMAGAYGNQANLAQQQAQNQNAFTGNLLGTGAKLGAAYMTGGASLAAPAAASAMNSTSNPSYSTGATKDNQTYYAQGGEVKDCCYAKGGEVHDHRLCMMAGGGVPGDDSQMDPGVDSTDNDTVPANLSPHEIVLPRSVAQAPDAPQQAAQFVQGIKGGQQPQDTTGMTPTVGSFQEALRILEANGLELRLTSGSN